MKRTISILLTVGLLAGLLCGTAQAADIQASGFYNIGTASGVTVIPVESDGSTADRTSANVDGLTGYETFYPGAVKLTVNLTGASSGSEYVVLLVSGTSGTALPTSESEIYYIDQVTAESTTVSFNVYPMEMTGLTDLTLFITSDEANFTTRSVSLHYAPAGTYEVQPYTLGDVNSDGLFNSMDALMALQIGAELIDYSETEKLAADVTREGVVNSLDALKILQYGAGLITSWDE